MIHCRSFSNDGNHTAKVPRMPAGTTCASKRNVSGYSQTSTGDFSLAFMGGLKHTLVELHSFHDRVADCQQVLVENGR
jgi:hypothetical protein